MHDAMNDLSAALTPSPEFVLGPRRLVAWAIITACLVVIQTTVKILPQQSPIRIFVSGATQTLRGALTMNRVVAAPAPSSPSIARGS